MSTRRVGPVLLALMALVLLGGCATGPPRGSPLSGSGLHSRGSAGGFPGRTSRQETLAPFLACTSPTEFIELQHRVDMPRLVEGLDDWSAVRLGALGPLRSGADVLNRKRATFLVNATREYGAARAELFALFLIHSAFTNDLHEVLLLLARDKQLGETLGRMGAVREALRQRGLNLSDYMDRPEHLGDVARGLTRAANEALSTSELRRGALAMKYSAQRGQLPPPYQAVLDQVERAEMAEAFSPENVAMGSFDALTLGVPLGFYNLVAGTCHGVYSLSLGQYEQATRELSAATVLVSLYVGGKGVRYLSEARGTTGTPWVRGRLQVPELGFEGLAEVAERLWARLGGDGIRELARYIQANREAALLVYERGEAGAMALHEARGDVARAQAWLSEARRPERSGPTPARIRTEKGLGGMTSLLDEEAGLSREVVEAKLAHAELDSAGPRLSGNVAVLEKQRPSLDTPLSEAQGHPLWNEYVSYWEDRLAELKQGKPVKPPLAWAGYEQMRGLFARGLAFERFMVSLLRADAALPRAQRRFLKDFDQPHLETNVGVMKSGVAEIRYADVLVIEEQPPSGQAPRVETFSFKSRDFRQLKSNALTAQMRVDAIEALRYYGGTLDIRRPSLNLRGSPVQVHRVRLIYEGGALQPRDPRVKETAMSRIKADVEGAEVLFQ
ncbi:hypothetical protein JQX13_25260 [Archangium violaceum]|uniref:hypothetical protein n=1 Tax=Archangium violaceum TaxID=83451 RepID=UPI00193C3E95|nr:hypothetical protein [Archangium violaceum]QRK13042.1 hypothetical protein JQX13_25260 [Archangium violaceum]